MLSVVGVVFLVLYFVGWIREALTLVTGWLLAGFGLSFFAMSLPSLAPLSLLLILLGLGIAFVAICVTSIATQVEQIPRRFWRLVPRALFLAMGLLLVLEGGIGPQGLGGRTTALAVHVETYPCHIASLPVAVNMQCHSTRHRQAVL